MAFEMPHFYGEIHQQTKNDVRLQTIKVLDPSRNRYYLFETNLLLWAHRKRIARRLLSATSIFVITISNKRYESLPPTSNRTDVPVNHSRNKWNWIRAIVKNQLMWNFAASFHAIPIKCPVAEMTANSNSEYCFILLTNQTDILFTYIFNFDFIFFQMSNQMITIAAKMRTLIFFLLLLHLMMIFTNWYVWQAPSGIRFTCKH